jgi:hypothetical protein
LDIRQRLAPKNVGAFDQTFMTGDEYAKWVDGEEQRHRSLMEDAGFLTAP